MTTERVPTARAAMLTRKPVAQVFEAFVDPAVTWTFTPRNDRTTLVSIAHWGFTGLEEEKTKQAIGATEGFALVLAGLKALLEHNVILNLVPDRFPDGIP